jgi:hypothetical protein
MRNVLKNVPYILLGVLLFACIVLALTGASRVTGTAVAVEDPAHPGELIVNQWATFRRQCPGILMFWGGFGGAMLCLLLMMAKGVLALFRRQESGACEPPSR